jgi:hypothetical protein
VYTSTLELVGVAIGVVFSLAPVLVFGGVHEGIEAGGVGPIRANHQLHLHSVHTELQSRICH